MSTQNWGVTWHEDIPHSRDNRCCECGDGTMGLSTIILDKWKKHLVGFCTENSAGIFKCPSCGNLFWFHLHGGIAGDLSCNSK